MDRLTFIKPFDMKYFFFLALSVCVFFAPACSDDDGTNPQNQGSDDCQISCKVDGTTISIDPANNCAYLGNTLNIGQTGQDAIQLQVNNLTATGTYDIADQSTVVIITMSNGTTIGGLTGQIVVTELSSSQASGTFSGSFYDLSDVTQMATFTVTEGSFSASF